MNVARTSDAEPVKQHHPHSILHSQHTIPFFQRHSNSHRHRHISSHLEPKQSKQLVSLLSGTMEFEHTMLHTHDNAHHLDRWELSTSISQAARTHLHVVMHTEIIPQRLLKLTG